MSLVNSLLNKPVEVTELQQKAQKIQKKADVNVSNLFTGQQTDHSRYIRAAVKSAEAVRSALDNKMSAMTSLLRAQISYEDQLAEDRASPAGEIDFSYSQRARIGARAGTWLGFDKDDQLRHNNDASVKKDRNAAREAEGRIDTSVIKEAVGAQKVASQKVHVASPVRGSGAGTKVQAKVSIRV